MKKLLAGLLVLGSFSSLSAYSLQRGLTCSVYIKTWQESFEAEILKHGEKKIKPLLWSYETHSDCFYFEERKNENEESYLSLSHYYGGYAGCSVKLAKEIGSQFSIYPDSRGVYSDLHSKIQINENIRVSCANTSRISE